MPTSCALENVWSALGLLSISSMSGWKPILPVEGISGVAAPIRDYTGQVRAALGSAVLQAQHTRESFARVIEAVRNGPAARVVDYSIELL